MKKPEDAGRSGRVLVVDDEPPIVFALREYFTLFGYLVDTAADLGFAKTCLAQQKYSVVIADYRLSGTTSQEGLELVTFVKMQHPDTKVVMLTAYGSPHVVHSACAQGVDAFFNKPMRLADLATVLTRLAPAGGAT
jgi:DNA-binding NtrC family response regulator